jgi:hypothetical protein
MRAIGARGEVTEFRVRVGVSLVHAGATAMANGHVVCGWLPLVVEDGPFDLWLTSLPLGSEDGKEATAAEEEWEEEEVPVALVHLCLPVHLARTVGTRRVVATADPTRIVLQHTT